MAIFDLKNATIVFQDGTMSPTTLTAKIGDGNFTFTEKRNIEYKRDRGNLDTVRLGDQEPVDIKFEFNWIFLKGDSTDTPTTTMEDALKRRGGAAAWVSTDSDTCAPYCIDIVITYTPPCTGAYKEVITIHEFRWEQLDHDAKAGTISCTGKANEVQVVPVRSAQS